MLFYNKKNAEIGPCGWTLEKSKRTSKATSSNASAW